MVLTSKYLTKFFTITKYKVLGEIAIFSFFLTDHVILGSRAYSIRVYKVFFIALFQNGGYAAFNLEPFCFQSARS